MAGPLEGIRVIDFGRFIAAPYCAMLLADMGADVIRVERREGGEDRGVGPVTETGEGGLYLNMNRNKRGMTLDLGHPRSREVVHALVRGSDVVIVNLPPPVLQKTGLDFDSIAKIRADVIMVMATAFGPDGPYANRIGFDGVAQAMSGAMSLTGFPGPPVRSIVSFVDYGTALHAALGVVSALYERQKTGRGKLIDVSLLATGVMFMLPLLAERATTGIARAQQGNTAYFAAPSDAYRTADGWIMVPTIGGDMFRRWAALMQREDLPGDPRLSTDLGRADHHQIINEVMAGWCASRTREQAISELERARIPCGPVYSLDEVLTDAQVNARGLLKPVDHPGSARPVPLAGTPVRFDGVDEGIRSRAPRLGEHTDEVLREAGLSDAEIEELRNLKVI